MKKSLPFSRLMRGVMMLVAALGCAVTALAANMDVGYVLVDENTVWPSDGWTTKEDDSVYFGVKLTSDITKNYAGCKILGFRVGWCAENTTGEYDIFLREGDFNAPDAVSQKATVKFGWNYIKLDNPYTIADNPGDLMMGFHVNTRAGEPCVPFSVLGNKPAGSAYMTFDTELDPAGNKIWHDVSAFNDALLMVAVVEVGGNMANRAEITNIFAPGLQTLGNVETGRLSITNRGSSPVRKVTLKYTIGDQEWEQECPISQAIKSGATAKVYLPVPTLATGETTVTISKVNGKDNGYQSSKTFEVIAVPENVAENYNRRGLLEYFTSENDHHTVLYFDDYIMGAYKNYAKRMSLICHHTDDQFMIQREGDTYDNATRMLIEYADQDLYKVMIPAVTLDRTVLPGNVIVQNKMIAFDVPSPDYAPQLFNAALAIPTFAGLSVSNAIDESREELTVTVDGEITDGVLPKGETLSLSIYLLEDNVASDAQDWATPEQQAAYGGIYKHRALVRDQPLPVWGDPLDGAGEFHRSYKIAIDPEVYKLGDLRTVAVLHRSGSNTPASRQVINCAEAPVMESSIHAVAADSSDATASVTPSRSIAVNGSTEGVEVYTTTGALTPNAQLPAGIYIVRSADVTAKIRVQ